MNWNNKKLLIEKLPGLVVCMSFSFVALKYYLEIFSNIYPKQLGKLGWVTNMWMRFGTFFWPPAILLVYVVNPSYWPYVCSYGTAVVVVNNFLCYRLGQKAEKKIEQTLKQNISNSTKKELEDFKIWWQLMLYYSVAIFIMGYLLINQLPLIMGKPLFTDEYAYAGIVLVLNYKLYRYNCNKLAPALRSTLQFYYSRYYRALKFEELDRNVN